MGPKPHTGGAAGTGARKSAPAEYLVDLNATQAAIRSGYSPKTAGVIGYENLKKPQIASAIAEAQAQLSERSQVTIETVVAELATLGFARLSEPPSASVEHSALFHSGGI